MWRSIISFGFLLWCSFCSWNQNNQIELPQNTIAFDYSIDSQYIWAISFQQVWVLQSRRGLALWKYSFNDRNLSTAGFNLNSSLLAVASEDGQVLVFKRNGRDFENFASYKNSNHSSRIQSLCFPIDGHSIVLGFYHDSIVVWQPESGNNMSKSFQNQYVFSVACSPVSANKFIVSGGNNTIGLLFSYQFNMQSKTFTIDNKTTVKQNVSTSCVYSSNGRKVYRVGDHGLIYVYDNNWVETTLLVNKIDKGILKIRVSQNERIIALLLPNQVAILNPSKSQSIIQTINISTNEMSLSSRNSHLLYFSKNEAWISGQCLIKQFVDEETGICSSCDAGCLYCEQNATNCYFCESEAQGYYLKQHECLRNGVHFGIVGGILAASIAIPILVYLVVRVIKKRKTAQPQESYETLE